MDPKELCVQCRKYLNTAVSDTDAVPSCPELCVLASVGKTDISHSWSIVPENVGHLKNIHQ